MEKKRKYWVKLLQKHLINFPRKSKEYIVPSHINITVHTKGIRGGSRYSSLGSSMYPASLRFTNNNHLEIIYLNPLPLKQKKMITIDLDKIVSINLNFLEPEQNKK